MHLGIEKSAMLRLICFWRGNGNNQSRMAGDV